MDKVALEAARNGIRRLFQAKSMKVVKEKTQEEVKKREGELERAYVRHLAFMHSGSAFGDIAFRTNGIRTSTVRTTRTSEMLLVEKEDYLQIMNSEVRCATQYLTNPYRLLWQDLQETNNVLRSSNWNSQSSNPWFTLRTRPLITISHRTRTTCR